MDGKQYINGTKIMIHRGCTDFFFKKNRKSCFLMQNKICLINTRVLFFDVQ